MHTRDSSNRKYAPNLEYIYLYQPPKLGIKESIEVLKTFISAYVKHKQF